MNSHDPLWSEINNLLSHLEGVEAVRLVEEYYARFNNPAPPLLLKNSIAKLQKRLDESHARQTPRVEGETG